MYKRIAPNTRGCPPRCGGCGFSSGRLGTGCLNGLVSKGGGLAHTLVGGLTGILDDGCLLRGLLDDGRSLRSLLGLLDGPGRPDGLSGLDGVGRDLRGSGLLPAVDGLAHGQRFLSGLGTTTTGGLAETLLGVEDNLADAHGLRGDLDALVVGGELEGLLQGEAARRHEGLEAVRGRGAHVGLLLLADHVDVHVLTAGVLPHDLTLVGLLGGLDEEASAVLQADERVGGHGPGTAGGEGSGGARVASSVSALTARETERCDTLNRSPMAAWGIWRRQIDVAHSDLATSRIAGMV